MADVKQELPVVWEGRLSSGAKWNVRFCDIIALLPLLEPEQKRAATAALGMDGYREMASRAANAENAIDDMRRERDAAIKRAEGAEGQREYLQGYVKELLEKLAARGAENAKLRAELATVAERQRARAADLCMFRGLEATARDIAGMPLVTDAPSKTEVEIAAWEDPTAAWPPCAECGKSAREGNHYTDMGSGHDYVPSKPAPTKSRCTCFWTDAGDGLHKTSFGPLVGECPEHGVNRPGQALDEWTDEKCDYIPRNDTVKNFDLACAVIKLRNARIRGLEIINAELRSALEETSRQYVELEEQSDARIAELEAKLAPPAAMPATEPRCRHCDKPMTAHGSFGECRFSFEAKP